MKVRMALRARMALLHLVLHVHDGNDAPKEMHEGKNVEFRCCTRTGVMMLQGKYIRANTSGRHDYCKE